MRTNGLLLLAPLYVLVSGPAQAGETGAVRGQVLDGDGLAIPNAEVVLTGVNIAGERTVTTDDNGEFRMLGLPPGPKEVLVKKEGFAPTKYSVTIRLDETAFVPVTLKSAVGEGNVLVIEETLPVVDTTRSAVSQQMTTDLLTNVPVGRSYQSAVNMVAGVYGRVDTQNGGPGNGNPSVRGEGSYGNNYMVDGISTRDPATKTFGSNVNFDAIQEIQVYTDGYPAEFSNATGMLVNVVTKDGGNEHFGSAGYYLDIPACYNFSGENPEINEGNAAEYEDARCYYDIYDVSQGLTLPTRKRSSLEQELSVTAGGPILKDKLWYFATLSLAHDNILYEALPPDAPYVSNAAQFLGKVTYFITPDMSVQYQYSTNPQRYENWETSGLYAPEAQGQRVSGSTMHLLSFRARPSEMNELEVKLSYWNLSLDQVPSSADGCDLDSLTDTGDYAKTWDDSCDAAMGTPAVRDENGYYTGNYDSFDFNDRVRLGGSIKYTQLVEDVFGDHKFKGGFEYWRLKVTRQLVYTGTDAADDLSGESWYHSDPIEGVYGSGYLFTSSEEYPCTEATGYTDCYGIRQSGDVDPISSYANTMGIFLQDDWSIDPLTLNIGFRLDREDLFQNDKTEIVDQWMPAPRFGAAWDVTHDSRTLVSLNAGRYYDLSGNDFVQWANTKSSNAYVEYRNNGAGGYDEVWFQDPAGNPLVYCTEQSIAQQVELENIDEATAEDIWKNFCNETTLKPYHMDKVVLGIKREIVPLFAVGLKGIMSHTTDFPEDVDYDLNTWVVTDPYYTNEDGDTVSWKVRDYRALELTAERKYDGVWQLLASYTLSEATGHMPGQFEISSGGSTGSDGNEVGVYLDDVNDEATREAYLEAGYGWLLNGLAGLGRYGDDSYYGYLPYHSFHQAKIAGSYTLPSKTTLGLVYEFDSGHAWQKRGYVDLYGDYFAFPEGRGTRFMPPVHYVNARVAQKFQIGTDNDLEVGLDIFNVLDLETPVTYYENEGDNLGAVLYRQSPMAFRLGLNYTY